MLWQFPNCRSKVANLCKSKKTRHSMAGFFYEGEETP